MIHCNFCQATQAPKFLYTLCRHFVCIECCYVQADFTTMMLECCRQATPIDPAAMSEIIKNKKNTRRDPPPDRQSKAEETHKNESRTMPKTERKEDRSPREDTQIQYISRFQPELVSTPIDILPKAHRRQSLVHKQTVSSQESTVKQLSNNSEQLSDLENILLLQIQKVKREFEEEHEELRKKEELIVKQLMAAYEDEIKNIERPISAAKLENFNLSMGKFNKRTRNQLVEQSQLYQSKENSSGSQTYDHIVKRLELNRQRMSEKIERHLQALN